MKNTKKAGRATLFFYKQGLEYVGVCLELDIIEYDSDLEKLQESLTEAVQSHFEGILKNNLSDNYLNTPAPKKYWDRYQKALRERASSKLLDISDNFIKDLTPSEIYHRTYA